MDPNNDLPIEQYRWTAGPVALTPSADLRAARDRAAAFLRTRATRPGLLARRLMGQPDPRDEQLADHLIRERRRRTRIDGSVDGALVLTAWTAWELLDLGCPPDHAAVVRTLGFVLAKQDRPGHFAEGCSEDRHRQRLCRHFLSGFFSPASRDEAVAPIKFRSGLVIDDEETARFAASCFALRVVLRAGEDRRAAVRRHVESLLGIDALWERLGTGWAPDLVFLALGALAFAPLDYRPQVEALAQRAAAEQRPDGTWEHADLLNALDMLSSVTTQGAREAVRRAAPLMCGLQTASGAVGEAEDEEQTLIGLRVLRIAEK